MPKIVQLSAHVANLIAAGEVVQRPSSVMKELLENAVDAGASQVTAEIRGGGMTFLRVTDNGCGMLPEDARLAFSRHATSKLRQAEDLAAITTMGFRGEALAAIASVSRIDLMTKTPGAVAGTSLHLESGQILEESEVGCPEGTTMIVRDLFFRTPARMKFMKQDSVEGAAATAAVQRQALAHPEVAFRLLRDGKEIFHTPGDGKLLSAVYGVYGREAGTLAPVDSHWEQNTVSGYVSKPTQARPSRAHQLFFVNGRPVKSKLLQSALEEAYRNQIMVGRFPACVLHLTVPANAVDVNVHPAKTEIKFLSEKQAFDCVHYGVLAALRKLHDRQEVRLGEGKPVAQQLSSLQQILAESPRPQAPKADAVAQVVLAQKPMIPGPAPKPQAQPPQPPLRKQPQPAPEKRQPDPVQQEIPLPPTPDYQILGELFDTYIVVQGAQEAWLIDKHAAHERILFEKLRAQRQEVSSQTLLTGQVCRLGEEQTALLLENGALLEELGYEVESFGEGTLIVRRCPMELDPQQAAECLADLAGDLAQGRDADRDTLRDRLLHTMACKAAIKAGWKTDPREREALVRQVLRRDDLRYCPHGRPICLKLTQAQLSRQFGRS